MQPMLERMMGEDVEIRLDLHPGEVWVHADPHQLEQVIMNLAVNARDAMPRGGRLSIATAAGEGADRGAVLTVSDSGTGMDAAVRQRIFEPFFTTKRPGEGTGLGLSMVQGIIAQSGGQIEVRSELGLGTTFEIRLPAQVQAVSDGTAASAAPVLGGTETILLVEDQPEVLRFAATVLSEYGYRVIQADCAADALRLSKREAGRIDLLLTDVVMPQVSGRELAAQMRELRPGIRILFMSGHTGDLILDHGALDAGVQFLQKPFSPGELAERVRAALALRSV
jgi:CheY-like chemotaxis protein